MRDPPHELYNKCNDVQEPIPSLELFSIGTHSKHGRVKRELFTKTTTIIKRKKKKKKNNDKNNNQKDDNKDDSTDSDSDDNNYSRNMTTKHQNINGNINLDNLSLCSDNASNHNEYNAASNHNEYNHALNVDNNNNNNTIYLDKPRTEPRRSKRIAKKACSPLPQANFNEDGDFEDDHEEPYMDRVKKYKVCIVMFILCIYIYNFCLYIFGFLHAVSVNL